MAGDDMVHKSTTLVPITANDSLVNSSNVLQHVFAFAFTWGFGSGLPDRYGSYFVVLFCFLLDVVYLRLQLVLLC